MLKEFDNWLFATYLKVSLGIESFVKKENGEANIIAVILILAIVIALVIIFRKQLKEMFDRIWNDASDNVEEAIGQY